MKESTEAQKNWKSEELRAERKARLAELKTKDGGKKPVRTGSRLATIILIVILVLALLGTGVWGALRLGLPQQHLTAMTVGSEKLTVIELNYYYHNVASQFQLDLNDPASSQTLKSDSGIEGFPTVEDYIKDVAAQQAQMNTMLADLADADGVALSEEDYAIIENFFTTIDSNARQNEVSTNAYLVSMFGKGATKEHLRPILEKYLLAQKFSTEKQASFVFTEDEVEQYYQENKNDYDRVSYRLFSIQADYETGAEQAVIDEAMNAAKLKASDMLGEITDEESFQQACIDFAKDENERISYEQSDRSLLGYRLKNSVSGTEAAEWLFDESRSTGDKKLVETSTGFQVILFVSRSDSSFSYVDVNHILIIAARGEAEDSEIEEAREKAESVLEEYLSGDKTQEAFEQLAMEYSEDGNALSGGLYESVYPGQMVMEFEQWSFDPARKVGDTDIVQTTYGFHVMYYAGADEKSDRQIRDRKSVV